MTNFLSRVAVAIVGLPLVLGLLWLGGWWLFVLVLVAALVGVHEFVTTARPLRPLAPAVYVGVVLALVGARTGGLVWMLAGFLATFVLGFVLDVVAKTRAPTTATRTRETRELICRRIYGGDSRNPRSRRGTRPARSRARASR